ncbi:MAG: DUF3822 family protein [Cyclobacteriaceae bacterium]
MLASEKSYTQLKELLAQLFEGHHLLTAGFWKKVRVAIKSNKFSLVPSGLFVKTALEDYLALNSRVNTETEKILYYKHIQTDAICVFAVNKVLHEWFESLYPNAELGFIHQSSALIEGVINYAAHHNSDSMYLYIDRYKVELETVCPLQRIQEIY